ncbi:hypothetical protein [Arhodomonas sp. SL1]|uniref:hypothetical protein n=1 Tax=Arhodomonas sp. SL1 TaxID=3425691 RepID=UPI003F88311D
MTEESGNAAQAEGELVRRLRAELAEARARAEEVAAYYRGELETIRQRAEEDVIRRQAEAAGRRKRAEEEAARLAAELDAVRREAEQAQRRYEDLRTQIAEDREGEAPEATSAELERLEGEIEALHTELEAERAARREQQRTHDQVLADQRATEERWRQLMARLRHGLKASEQRRKALEATVKRQAAAAEARRWDAPEMEVDPGAGWGQVALGVSDDLAEEFAAVEGDRSLDPEWRKKLEERCRGEAAGTDDESVPDEPDSETTRQETEVLLEGLHVDQRVARREQAVRQASEDEADASVFEAREPGSPPPPPEKMRSVAGDRRGGLLYRLGWVVLVLLAAALVGLAFL